MAFELPPLPYAMDALAPHISQETLEYHYGKHHQTYVTNLNKLIEGTEDDNAVARGHHHEGRRRPLFNNAAQVVEPHLLLELHDARRRRRAHRRGGRQDQLGLRFLLATSRTSSPRRPPRSSAPAGPGWSTTVRALAIMKTANADLPMKHGAKALLTIDVWEHAYYIDFRNARPNYIETFIDNLVNWDFVAKNLG